MTFLPKNKHPYAYLQRPNDMQTNARSIHYPVAVRFVISFIITYKLKKGNIKNKHSGYSAFYKIKDLVLKLI